MALSAEEVRYIASLARLRFDAAEEAQLAGEMSRILEYMAKLNEIDTSSVPPMSHVLDLTNVFRADVVEERITREEALTLASGADEQYFSVPKVIE